MKPHQRLARDEMGFSNLPEGGQQARRSSDSTMGRNPSEMLQAEVDSPLMNCQYFKPAIDEFMKNGPSADVETIKNFAAEIASMNAQLDPARLSMEIDNSLGVGNSRNFGLLRSSDLGFSLSSFSSLVDFGEVDKTGDAKNSSKAQREQSWQKSVSELVPSENTPEKFHKEYKCYESSDKRRLTSKDWTVDYSMTSTAFAPTNEASSELTNNVVTYVTMNDMSNYKPAARQETNSSLSRPAAIDDSKRQMSVEISTASIGIDEEGRLGSYELIKTQLNMEPNLRDTFDEPIPLDAFPVQSELQTSQHMLQQQFQQQQQQFNLQQQHAQQAFDDPRLHQFGTIQSQISNMQRPNIVSQPQVSIGTQIRGLDLVVPPRTEVKLSPETGVIQPHEIQDSDVLLERGGKGNHHRGSRFYRRLINERRQSYQDLPDSARAEKMSISLSVVMSLKASGARFIHKKKGRYVVMSDREARNKISQALREKKERVMLDG